MSKKTEMEIVDGLIEGCKTQPLPQDPLWQCFLESSQSVHPGVTLHPPPSTGLDGAKLHCCSKANTSTCRSVSQFPLLKSVENSILINDFRSGKYVLCSCIVETQEFRRHKIFHSFFQQIFIEHHVSIKHCFCTSSAKNIMFRSVEDQYWQGNKYLKMMQCGFYPQGYH